MEMVRKSHPARLTLVFQNNVRDRMAAIGLSQRSLAQLLDCTQPNINRMLSADYEPGLEFVQRVADALGCDPVDLLTAPVAASIKAE